MREGKRVVTAAKRYVWGKYLCDYWLNHVLCLLLFKVHRSFIAGYSEDQESDSEKVREDTTEDGDFVYTREDATEVVDLAR